MTPFLILGVLYIAGVAASVSRQIQLGDLEYFIPPEPAWKLKDWNVSAHDGEFTPLTVVGPSGLPIDGRINLAAMAYERDDVWTKHFTQVLYFKSGSDEAHNVSSEYNVSAIYTGTESVPAGPYFVHRYTGDVYRAYRLYVDSSQAFIQSTYQDPNGTHHPLRAGIQSTAGLTIAVPSRLYFTRTKKQPLAGLRIAWYDMSKVKTETAIAVQKLIDAGAVIVGKNKLSEFAFAGMFVTEHIDYLLPVNPRGDGYQSPSDSSGGSAAAVASYDWLDASLGSDTGGSIRGPASTNGVHGGRPTQDAVNLTGALPLSVSMDTAGIIVRDPRMWARINKVLYDDELEDYDGLPSEIFLDPSTKSDIQDLERKSTQAAEAVEGFLDGLSKILSAKPKTIDVDNLWSNSTPKEYNGTSLGEAVGILYGKLTRWEQWTEIGKDFIDDYRDSHNGSLPYVVDGTRRGWLEINKTYTEELHEEDLALKSTIEDWVAKELLTPSTKSCSKAIYIYISVAGMLYKPDIAQTPSTPPSANSWMRFPIKKLQLRDSTQQSTATRLLGRLASVAGIPDYSISLGAFDMGSVSNVTLQNQSTPVSVNIMAGRGCDFVIFDIVEALYKEGLIREVKSGAIP
ncbi:hypothetical protein NXS19_014351 [Fusarium pseudograminearum]|nr:hypothetical protein NXS19_014351 [Fusarium pseudograminearum]